MYTYDLSANWKATGKDFDDFQDIIVNLTSKTACFLVDSSKVKLFHIEEFSVTPQGTWKYTLMDEDGNIHSAILPKEVYSSKEFQKIKSEIETNRLYMGYKQKDSFVPFYFDAHSLITFGQKIGLAGDWFFNPGKNTKQRNLALIAAYKAKRDDLKFMFRKDGYVRKIFAVFSEKYSMDVTQDELLIPMEDILVSAKLGEYECDSWEVDQNFTRITFSFPKYAKDIATVYGLHGCNIIPCITFMNSDTGDCSLKAIATWKIGNSYSYGNEFSQKHIGKNLNLNDMKLYCVEKIFDKYTTIPEKLCELMSIDVTNQKNDYEYNKKVYIETLKNVLKEIGFVKAIGIKKTNELMECLVAEYNSIIDYTAYDLCVSIMELPERARGLNKIQTENLAKACYNAPFAKMYKSEKVYLVA